jgi:hypothetical protein
MLWAYFSFSQYLIIYSGNLPEEITWYTHRLQTSWRFIGLLLVLAHFVVPFLLLLSRPLKREPEVLVKVAIGIVVVRVVDLFWLIAPQFHQEHLSISWMDIVLPLALSAIWACLFRQARARHSADLRSRSPKRSADWSTRARALPTSAGLMDDTHALVAASGDSLLRRERHQHRGISRSLSGSLWPVVVHVVIWIMFMWLQSAAAGADSESAPGRWNDVRLPPEPRLQVEPRQDLDAYREREAAILEATWYGSTDAAWFRLPIDEAMKRIARDAPADAVREQERREPIGVASARSS